MDRLRNAKARAGSRAGKDEDSRGSEHDHGGARIDPQSGNRRVSIAICAN
jgi:hypothetical protein